MKIPITINHKNNEICGFIDSKTMTVVFPFPISKEDVYRVFGNVSFIVEANSIEDSDELLFCKFTIRSWGF